MAKKTNRHELFFVAHEIAKHCESKGEDVKQLVISRKEVMLVCSRAVISQEDYVEIAEMVGFKTIPSPNTSWEECMQERVEELEDAITKYRKEADQTRILYRQGLEKTISRLDVIKDVFDKRIDELEALVSDEVPQTSPEVNVLLQSFHADIDLIKSRLVKMEQKQEIDGKVCR